MFNDRKLTYDAIDAGRIQLISEIDILNATLASAIVNDTAAVPGITASLAEHEARLESAIQLQETWTEYNSELVGHIGTAADRVDRMLYAATELQNAHSILL